MHAVFLIELRLQVNNLLLLLLVPYFVQMVRYVQFIFHIS